MDETDQLSKLKRTACVLCRKRKLKCDGVRPKCQTCNRLGHECKYDEIRRKSGPKRGYVKALEARLAQVETQLKHGNESTDDFDLSYTGDMSQAYPPVSNEFPALATLPDLTFGTMEGLNDGPAALMGSGPAWDPDKATPGGAFVNMISGDLHGLDNPMTWDLISLGLEEPLPSDHVVAELTDIYFAKIHPTLPLLNKGKFMSNMHLAPKARPAICLRYAMWTLAAGMEDKYAGTAEILYRRARKYLELDEMRSFGESMVTLQYCQSWILVSTYEFKNMLFPRAWMSTGRACRIAQMLGLHRIDGQSMDVKQCLPPAISWMELEERRRTFWTAFWGDRCASIGTGWPMMLDEQDIMTRLPASEEAYQFGFAEETPTISEAYRGKIDALSGFAAATLLIRLLGCNLLHIHRSGPGDREDDLAGPFWQRHRDIDGQISAINLSLATHLRIPFGLPDPNVIFLNMCVHATVICLHQAAIFKADKYKMPAHISQESKLRCLTAAGEIASITRAISHLDLSTMNPFMAFCLYICGRVFVQYLKARRDDQQIQTSLNFVLQAMHTMKRWNGLTESFIAQLDLDLEAAGIANPHYQGSLENIIKKGVPLFPRNGKDLTNMKNIISVGGSVTKDVEDSLQATMVCTQIINGNMSGIGGGQQQETTIPVSHQRQQQAPPPVYGASMTPNWPDRMPDSSIGIFKSGSGSGSGSGSASGSGSGSVSTGEARGSPATVSDSATDTNRSPGLLDNEPVAGQSSYPNMWNNINSNSAGKQSQFQQQQQQQFPPQQQQQQQHQQQQQQQRTNYFSTGASVDNPAPPSASLYNTNNDTNNTSKDFDMLAAQLFPPTADGAIVATPQAWDWSATGIEGLSTGITPDASGFTQEYWNDLMNGSAAWGGDGDGDGVHDA